MCGRVPKHTLPFSIYCPYHADPGMGRYSDIRSIWKDSIRQACLGISLFLLRPNWFQGAGHLLCFQTHWLEKVAGVEMPPSPQHLGETSKFLALSLQTFKLWRNCPQVLITTETKLYPQSVDELQAAMSIRCHKILRLVLSDHSTLTTLCILHMIWLLRYTHVFFHNAYVSLKKKKVGLKTIIPLWTTGTV